MRLTKTNDQPGYDLLHPYGLRVSVEMITSSTGVDLNEATIGLVDRIIVVWLNTFEDQLKVEVVYDDSTQAFIEDCAAPYRVSK